VFDAALAVTASIGKTRLKAVVLVHTGSGLHHFENIVRRPTPTWEAVFYVDG
jgi:hypothetical protein